MLMKDFDEVLQFRKVRTGVNIEWFEHRRRKLLGRGRSTITKLSYFLEARFFRKDKLDVILQNF